MHSSLNVFDRCLRVATSVLDHSESGKLGAILGIHPLDYHHTGKTEQSELLENKFCSVISDTRKLYKNISKDVTEWGMGNETE